MNKDEVMYAIQHPETLPEMAYCTLSSDSKQVIIVKKGESGYYPFQKYPTIEDAVTTCDYCNENIAHATKEQAYALMILSMRKP